MPETCRACGRENPSEGIPFQAFQSQARIYFELTSVQLHQHENPDLLKLCPSCVDKLADFDHFRDICCRVHWDLLKVKAEPEDYIDSKTLKVEQNAQSNEDDDSEDGKYLSEIPCTTMLFVTSNESTKNEFLSEEEEEEPVVTPKKARAKYGSLKKPSKPVPYSCDQCSETFQDKLLLIAHVRGHAGLVPYYCETCQQEFATLLDMKMHHVEKHTQRRTVTCDEPGCEEQFGSYQALRHHKLRTHDPTYTGPIPKVYMCENCGESFETKQKYTRHKFSKHEQEEKPYHCEFCSMQFAKPYQLKRHMVRHAGIRRHVCPYCAVAKVTRGELVSHMNNIHKDKPPLSKEDYLEAAYQGGDTEPFATSEEATPPQKRKRPQKEGWLSSVQKRNRNLGKAYVRKDNVFVEGKTFQRQFECGCPKMCWKQFESEGILEKFFNQFWNLGDWHKQNALLADQVKPAEVNRHRGHRGNNPRPERTVSFQYFIPSEQENVRVCQKYFLGILQVSGGRLYKCLGRK